MVADFSIRNNPHSSGQRNQQALRRLAKEIFDNAEKKERSIERVLETKEDFTTKTYIPAETYIYNISARACQSNRLEKSLKFLNSKAALSEFRRDKDLSIKENKDEIFEVDIDETKNIFAA